MIRKAFAAAVLAAVMFVALLASVLTPTASPTSAGAANLMVLAAVNAKEGQGDLTCGPTGPVGPGAQVAAAAAARAGWTGVDLVTAVAVAGAESGWRPGVTHINGNGSIDYGLWQINSVHVGILASGDWADPYDNAAMAHTVWAAAGGSWSPWTTFTGGAYTQYLPAAQGAVRGVAVPQTCAGDPPSGPDHLTPFTRAMRADVAAAFPGLTIGCYRAAEDGGEHPRGRACDTMVYTDRAKGDAIAAYAQANAARLHVLYLIWFQRIWSPARADEGWRPMADRGGITQNHQDHVHLSVTCGPGDPVGSGCP